jgi:hypothetical protein
VETKFNNLQEEEKREECKEYGLIYFFRKTELNKSEALNNQTNIWSSSPGARSLSA